MDAYRAAKRRLFFDNKPQCAVVNLDDAFGRTLAGELRGRIPVVGYGFLACSNAGCDTFVQGEHLELTAAGLRMTVTSSWGQGAIQSQLIGDFNGANLLAVLGTLLALDIPFAEALEHVAEVSAVPGRMECFGGQAGKPRVVVDYAHTPQALEQALGVLRRLCQGQLWCVFGCGGERDPGKRPLMGACVERFADHVIVTDDNPRGEDPQAIVDAIRSGMKHPDAPRVIRDRRTAITRALAESTSEDIVLVAGKGHEDYQLVGTRRVPISDRDIVRQWMAANP
jgi:UDP-N-acetylmuramoyl-L-alanyl-D-glutamate--2,6-diaminopimelate ligase